MTRRPSTQSAPMTSCSKSQRSSWQDGPKAHKGELTQASAQQLVLGMRVDDSLATSSWDKLSEDKPQAITPSVQP